MILRVYPAEVTLHEVYLAYAPELLLKDVNLKQANTQSDADTPNRLHLEAVVSISTFSEVGGDRLLAPLDGKCCLNQEETVLAFCLFFFTWIWIKKGGSKMLLFFPLTEQEAAEIFINLQKNRAHCTQQNHNLVL